MQAAVLPDFGPALSFADGRVPEPHEGQVLLGAEVSGSSHSHLHIVDGDLPRFRAGTTRCDAGHFKSGSCWMRKG